jgi:hypothetical protein
MVERIFSASASGRRGRAPSKIDLIEANISPEEIAADAPSSASAS